MEEQGKFPEIDKLVAEASEIELAIYDYSMRMYSSLDYIRPVSVRVAMMEDGKTYPQEKDPNLAIKEGCLSLLGKLIEVGILCIDSDEFSSESEDGFYNEYSTFESHNFEKLNYLRYLIFSAELKSDTLKFSNLTLST
ncbi:MAG TPA: hypothetical protein VFE71_02740 [Bacteroidales bacterium]|nr:hypothetical protein [Bacteroidales bacterium]